MAQAKALSDVEIDKLTKNQCAILLEEAKLPKSGKVEVMRNRVRNSSSSSNTESKVKKKKRWGFTDPAEIAPNYYQEDLFKSCFPLVDVIKVEEGEPFPVNDKFSGVTLDTSEARKLWSRRLVDVSRCYKVPETEKQAVAFHLALIEQLYPFTLPSKREVERVRGCRAGQKRKWSCLGEGDDDGEETLAGFSIEVDRKDVPGILRHGGPNSRMSIQAENSAHLTGDLHEDDDIPTGFADSVIRVHDYRPKKRAKTRDEAAGQQSERVAAVLERKFAEDSTKHRAVWQGGYYVAKYAEVNVQNGHGTPLSVLVQTSHSWTYALLVPEGYVQLRGGVIDPDCELAFNRHQQFTSLDTLGSLGSKLVEATKSYRKFFRDNPQACYRDGPQLVDDGGFGHLGARRLFDGLLRLLLGDSVLNMSWHDLARRVKLNEEMKDALNDSVQ